MDFFTQHDFCFTVKLKKSVSSSDVVDLLTKALKTRIHSLDSKCEKIKNDSNKVSTLLTVGLVLNQESYDNPLEKGPSANSSEANEFRRIWREKSEMRKFPDTSICEAVLWPAITKSDKRGVVAQIVKFLLSRHFNIKPESVNFSSDVFRSLLSANFLKGTGEEESINVQEAFDRITQCLRIMDDLPLTITRVFSVEPTLRQTEVFPVLPLSPFDNRTAVYVHEKWQIPRPSHYYAPPWCQSMEVQITFETSGKWPDDVDAVRKLKTAFYLKIAEMFVQQFRNLVVVREDCVFVLMSGFIFRLVIVYQREVYLLRTKLSATGVVETKTTEESSQLEKQIVHRPKLCGYFNGIILQHPTFCLSCRLLKRWISSHMLSEYINDEAVELLVAYVYLNPYPWNAPGSSANGFLRTLQLLATFDWLKQPLIVNLNKEFEKSVFADIRKRFVDLRPTLPPMCIVTPDDHLGTRWTKPQPNAMIVERLTHLARSSLQVLEKNFNSNDPAFYPKVIFRTPLDVFDVLIYLKTRQIPRRFMHVDCETSSLIGEDKQDFRDINVFPVVDYDPVELFVKDLKTHFDNSVMFFFDKNGGNVVGALLKPTPAKPSRKKLKTETETFNVERFSEMVELIGRGLVKKIVVK